MNGQLTSFAPGVYFRRFVQTPVGSTPSLTLGTPYITYVGEPTLLKTQINNIITVLNPAPANITPDTKIYLKQDKVSGFVTNHSNVPITIQVTKAYARKQVAKSEFSTVPILLDSDNAMANYPFVPLTFSNTAFRNIKFGKTKMMTLQPNQRKRYKLSVKYRTPKLITTAIDLNTAMLLNKWTRMLMFKVIPQLQVGGASGFTGMPGSFCLSWTETAMTSFYLDGYNNPQAFLAPLYNASSSSDPRLDVFTDETQQELAAL